MKRLAHVLVRSAGRALVALAALLALFAPCLTAQAAPAPGLPEVIRIGVADAGGGDPLNTGGSVQGVVRDRHALEDAFKADGVRVDWLFFKGAGPAVNEALSNKQIDFAYQGDLPSVVGRANGLKTRILLESGRFSNVYVAVPHDSTLKTIEDLKGQRVSLFRGTNAQTVADNILAAHHLTERDLKIINLDNASALAALSSHGVDAAFGGFEYFKLRDAGLIKLIYSTKGGDPALTRQAHWLVLDEFAQKSPQAVQKVVDTFVQSARWSSDEANRDALFRIWAKTGVPYATWQADFEGQPLAPRESPLIDEFITHHYQAVADDALKLKLIRQPVSINGWFDTSFLQKALVKQGLEHYWTRYDANGATQGK
jgi:sulfonate transport system substrate-binding protein